MYVDTYDECSFFVAKSERFVRQLYLEIFLKYVQILRGQNP